LPIPVELQKPAHIFLHSALRESLTQFNREYSRFFGQPPKRNIKALRLALGEANPAQDL